MKKMTPQIFSIDSILELNLVVPDYQRAYKWSANNISDLILDTMKSIEERKKYEDFKYRIGTVILYKNENDQYEIIDGQQRLLSLLLLKLNLEPGFTCFLGNSTFTNKITQKNLHDNYGSISEWFSVVSEDEKKEYLYALKNILEVVVIIVDKIQEAFQLFDSQNTRGKALYPHDLLKAYHLREIKDKYEMQNAVVKWESKKPEKIRELFDRFLFPISNWSRNMKSKDFTVNDIDGYKGIEEKSGYTYAKRANRGMPYFLLTEPFITGSDFFEMVDHYNRMLINVKEEIITNPAFIEIKTILLMGKVSDEDEEKANRVMTVDEFDNNRGPDGLGYVRRLFLCALLSYYDRFHNFDLMAVKKLFIWAMMIRIDMERLGPDTINLYAIGKGDAGRYSNMKPVFSNIAFARRHHDISTMKVNMQRDNSPASEKWSPLYQAIIKLNG